MVLLQIKGKVGLHITCILSIRNQIIHDMNVLDKNIWLDITLRQQQYMYETPEQQKMLNMTTNMWYQKIYIKKGWLLRK